MQSVEDKESCRCVCSIGLFPVSCGSLEGHTPRDDVMCELWYVGCFSVIGFCREKNFSWMILLVIDCFTHTHTHGSDRKRTNIL